MTKRKFTRKSRQAAKDQDESRKFLLIVLAVTAVLMVLMYVIMSR